jgi:hypothetical protein
MNIERLIHNTINETLNFREETLKHVKNLFYRTKKEGKYIVGELYVDEDNTEIVLIKGYYFSNGVDVEFTDDFNRYVTPIIKKKKNKKRI